MAKQQQVVRFSNDDIKQQTMSGQERVEATIREGKADGRRWAQSKADRGTLYYLSYFTVYMDAFWRGAQEVVQVFNTAPDQELLRELGIPMEETQ
jgi:hypothetical protein